MRNDQEVIDMAIKSLEEKPQRWVKSESHIELNRDNMCIIADYSNRDGCSAWVRVIDTEKVVDNSTKIYARNEESMKKLASLIMTRTEEIKENDIQNLYIKAIAAMRKA